MDSADADFLHYLFKENNDLRSKYTGLQREAIEVIQPREVAPTTENKPQITSRIDENTQFTLEAQKEEILKLSEEVTKFRKQYLEEKDKSFKIASALEELEQETKDLRKYKEDTAKELELKAIRDAELTKIPNDIATYKEQLRDAQIKQDSIKARLTEIATEANRRHNLQQNQLQGVEILLASVRREYEEFISITKIENESFRTRQQSEYEKLKTTFENYKNTSFEEKKNLAVEYQNILSAMQALFDEYRSTTEWLFNSEIAKLEEEITSQATRFEQEIMYVIQAKDKFYMDMMIAKDAKIMGLIEGSDLQGIMQKHEIDMENVRKEHQKEIERVKSEHDSENKHVILLLQRQNVSLESKTEKIQSHLKTMETHMRDLMATIELKNKTIAERDELRQKSDMEFTKKMQELMDKITQLTQEKEHLRHRVIRLNLNARGEGGNSVENMLKRISKDTAKLQREFEEMTTKYSGVLTETQQLEKKVRDKDKTIEFLEKEIKKRNSEYADMTQTFEEFLAGRAKQAKRDRLARIEKNLQKDAPSLNSEAKANLCIKATIPERSTAKTIKEKSDTKSNDIQRGLVYLKRFKNLSRAFATGELRAISNVEHTATELPGPWQKTPLYAKLEEKIEAAKVYNQNSSMLPNKTTIYQKMAHTPQIKMYHERLLDGDLKNREVMGKNTTKSKFQDLLLDAGSSKTK